MNSHSCSLSGPGLVMISPESPTLPTSCRSPALTIRSDRFPRQPDVRASTRLAGDVVGVIAEVGVALRECGVQHRGDQLRRAAPTDDLLAVHVLIREPQRLGRLARFAQDLDAPAEASTVKASPCSASASRASWKSACGSLTGSGTARRTRRRPCERPRPVAAARSPGSAEPLEQRVTGGVTEGVVVVLEAVEVEEPQKRRLLLGRAGATRGSSSSGRDGCARRSEGRSRAPV